MMIEDISKDGMFESIDAFADAMKHEYNANLHKPGRDQWITWDPRLLINDALYHAAKMSLAMKEGRDEKVQEYAADTANIMLMALEAFKSQRLQVKSGLPASVLERYQITEILS